MSSNIKNPSIRPEPFQGWPSDKDVDDPLYHTEEPKEVKIVKKSKTKKKEKK